MFSVFISHKFGQNSREARIAQRVFREFNLSGIVMGGPDARPPWDVIRKRIRSSCSLLAIYGAKESAKVHNELGMAWGIGNPCFALVDTHADYSYGIAELVLSYRTLNFEKGAFKSEVRTIARRILKENSNLQKELDVARHLLFTKLRRDPTIAELASHVGRTQELISQFGLAEPARDEYAHLGQRTRYERMVMNLAECWSLHGMGTLSLGWTDKRKATFYVSDAVRFFGKQSRFYFMVFAGEASQRLDWWRNHLCQCVHGAYWPVIVLVSYGKYSRRGFQSFMQEWGGNYSLLPDVEPGVDFFGPGIGYTNVRFPKSKSRISEVMTPTLILKFVTNKEVLSERIRSMLKWISSHRVHVFPRPVIKKDPTGADLLGLG